MRYKEIYSKFIIKIYHTQHDIAKTFFVDFAIRVNEHLSLKKIRIFWLFFDGLGLTGFKKGCPFFSLYTI